MSNPRVWCGVVFVCGGMVWLSSGAVAHVFTGIFSVPPRMKAVPCATNKHYACCEA